MTDAARLESRINELAAIGGSGTSVTRLGLSAEEQRARDLVAAWCKEHGATVRHDAAANLFVRFAGERANDPAVRSAFAARSRRRYR